jgi:hypothetical protein
MSDSDTEAGMPWQSNSTLRSTARLFLGVLSVSAMLTASAAAGTKKPKPAAPQASAGNSAPCRGANLFYCGPIYNSTDYLGTDPDPFIRAQIQRDLGAKYGGPE